MRINLLPKEERPLKQSQVRWEFLVSLVGVLLLGAVLAFSWLEAAKIHTLNSALNEARSREAFLQKQVQAVQSLRRDLTVLETQEKNYGDLVAEQSLRVLPALTKHPFSQLWIEALVWRDSGIELVGYTQDMTSLSLYLNYLNELSDQALLQAVYPHEGTEFFVFSIEVKGVGGDDPA